MLHRSTMRIWHGGSPLAHPAYYREGGGYLDTPVYIWGAHVHCGVYYLASIFHIAAAVALASVVTPTRIRDSPPPGTAGEALSVKY
jgi:hypothetical protein